MAPVLTRSRSCSTFISPETWHQQVLAPFPVSEAAPPVTPKRQPRRSPAAARSPPWQRAMSPPTSSSWQSRQTARTAANSSPSKTTRLGNQCRNGSLPGPMCWNMQPPTPGQHGALLPWPSSATGRRKPRNCTVALCPRTTPTRSCGRSGRRRLAQPSRATGRTRQSDRGIQTASQQVADSSPHLATAGPAWQNRELQARRGVDPAHCLR